jgi:hypothetical protein
MMGIGRINECYVTNYRVYNACHFLSRYLRAAEILTAAGSPFSHCVSHSLQKCLPKQDGIIVAVKEYWTTNSKT